MPSVDMNTAAVIVAILLNMVLGFLWYGPLFGKAWMQYVGLTEAKVKNADRVTPTVAMLVLAAVQVFVLVHFIAYAHYFYPSYSNAKVGFTTGLWAWVGFVLPVVAGSHLFAQRRKKLLLLDAAYYLVVLLANGLLLAVWR